LVARCKDSLSFCRTPPLSSGGGGGGAPFLVAIESALHCPTNIIYCLFLHQLPMSHNLLRMVIGRGSSHYSDSPFLQQPIIPTAHFSDNPLFRQPITPTMTNIYINFVIFLKPGPGAIKHENFLKYEKILNCHGNVEMLTYNWLRMKIGSLLQGKPFGH
jgi:hypothetical protein